MRHRQELLHADVVSCESPRSDAGRGEPRDVDWPGGYGGVAQLRGAVTKVSIDVPVSELRRRHRHQVGPEEGV